MIINVYIYINIYLHTSLPLFPTCSTEPQSEVCSIHVPLSTDHGWVDWSVDVEPWLDTECFLRFLSDTACFPSVFNWHLHIFWKYYTINIFSKVDNESWWNYFDRDVRTNSSHTTVCLSAWSRYIYFFQRVMNPLLLTGLVLASEKREQVLNASTKNGELSGNYWIFSILGSLTIYFLINIIGHPLCFVCFSSGAEKGAAFVEGTGWLVALVTLNFSYLLDFSHGLWWYVLRVYFQQVENSQEVYHITKGPNTPRPPSEAPHWIGLQVSTSLPSHMDVSANSGTPESSNLIGFSIINHPFWGTPIFGNTHIHLSMFPFPEI